MATPASAHAHGVELSERPWDSKRWPLQAGDLNLDDGCPSFLEKCFDEAGHAIDAEIQAQINEWAASEDAQRELAIFGGDVLNGRSFLEANLRSLRNPGDMTYTKCPEACRSPDVPRGKVVFFEKHSRPSSELYPGVTHDMDLCTSKHRGCRASRVTRVLRWRGLFG